jgi:hypothetical protein
LVIVPWMLSLIIFPESRYDMRNSCTSFRVLEFVIHSCSCLLLYQRAHRKCCFLSLAVTIFLFHIRVGIGFRII